MSRDSLFAVGSVVRFRAREWVILGEAYQNHHKILYLRPLTGTSEDRIAVHLSLSQRVGSVISEEQIQPAHFPLPDPEKIGDAAGVQLLWNAARLLLREGAAPFRSLGRIGFRPRPYQLVPLMMALRMGTPVRLLIADDVGVGKTIEAGLIARELWDRRKIQRITVLCPPYLLEQWAQELREKFFFDPVIISSGTIGRLERMIPQGKSVYEWFPVQVISLDFVKLDRNRHLFLQYPPDLVIVDEAHGAVPGRGQRRHLRYQLVRALARDPRRHLLLLTATPHSGIEESFQKLLGLLKPEFEAWSLSALGEEQRKDLAKHFVQRTRKDILKQWEPTEHLFPERVSEDQTYRLSPAYERLFQETLAFGRRILQSGESLVGYRRRLRYWSALSLLRCVMSSPWAARAALQRRRQATPTAALEEGDEEDYGPYAYEPTEETPPDEAPTALQERAETTLSPSERRKLRELEQHAARLSDQEDHKLQTLISLVHRLLSEGFHPVVWCFYVDTAEYVAEKVKEALQERVPDLQVTAVTGRLSEEERRLKVESLMQHPGPRVLVSTDCLAEGINLQEGFNAVIHYDLPWNPNRLEQREGRVDRYGQPSPKVQAVMLYGEDNPVDGAVIRVLLRKADEIRRTLGTYVPVPEDDEKIVEALVRYLFSLRQGPQLFEDPTILQIHRRWDQLARREKESRTRFAQRALKPQEVAQELQATDRVLGSPEAVQNFVLSALQRLGIPYDQPTRGVFRVILTREVRQRFPRAVQEVLPQGKDPLEWQWTFHAPDLPTAEVLTRNHPFVTTLARALLEQALEGAAAEPLAYRIGVLKSHQVSRLTTLLLLRARYRVQEPDTSAYLAEEVLTLGWEGFGETWLPADHALHLLADLRPSGNLSTAEKRELAREMLDILTPWIQAAEPGDTNPLWSALQERARALETRFRRVRQASRMRLQGLQVRPYWPPDVLGLLVIQPLVEG